MPEDRDIATPVFDWLAVHGAVISGDDSHVAVATVGGEPVKDVSGEKDAAFRPLWDSLRELAAGPGKHDIAVAEMSPDGSVSRALSWQQLDRNIRDLADGLREIGVGSGSRVSLMVRPALSSPWHSTPA